MKPVAIILLLTFLWATLPALANDDVVQNALVDEMQRSLKELHLQNHPPPYFISYTIKETESVEIVSSLGAEPSPHHYRVRYLVPDVRVGNYDLDNSNYGPGKDKFFDHATFVSTDDDYTAIRRSVWLKTDEAYKSAIENLEAKKSYLNENKIANRLPDMTAVEPVTSINPTKQLACDEKRWMETVRQLSAIFANYPHIQASKVVFLARQTNRWVVNSEGTRIRESRPSCGLCFWGLTQTADGKPVLDQETIAGDDENQLPSVDELKAIVDGLARRISALMVAPAAEDYCGPVLFEDQGAAEFISQVLVPNLSSSEECIHPITAEDGAPPRNPLQNMLHRRILPSFLNLIDDPKPRYFHAGLPGTKPLVGGYDFDEQGVPAQKVVLAENGLLKGFCQSRIPTRFCGVSNGHANQDRSDTSIIELAASQTLSAQELKQKLMELGKDEGLKYVLIIRRINDFYDLDDYYPPEGAASHATPSHSRQPTDPMQVFRVNVDTGQEELVSGLEFRFVSLRSFRDIKAVGDDAQPYFVQPSGTYTRSLITPSYIVGELELSKVDPEQQTPPKLPSPLLPP